MSSYLVPIIVACVGSSGLWTFLQWNLTQRLTKNEAAEKIAEDIKYLKQSHEDMRKEIDELKINTSLTLSLSRDRLNNMCNNFMNSGFIPQDDYVSFKLLGEAYIKAGGNSEVKTKFEYCIENLDVK